METKRLTTAPRDHAATHFGGFAYQTSVCSANIRQAPSTDRCFVLSVSFLFVYVAVSFGTFFSKFHSCMIRCMAVHFVAAYGGVCRDLFSAFYTYSLRFYFAFWGYLRHFVAQLHGSLSTESRSLKYTSTKFCSHSSMSSQYGRRLSKDGLSA